MKRIGLMGCGTVADYGHAPTIKSTPGLELHAIYEPDPARLAAFAARHGVQRAYSDVEEFFRSGIDAVAITSPAPCHLANLAAAARHGKHVLCEKPLADTEQAAGQMIDHAGRAGIMLVTGFDYRYSPVSQAIRQLVREGAIGQVRALRLIYVWNCHGKFEKGQESAGKVQLRRGMRMEEGGPLIDCGVHQIDLARWWLGSEPVAWHARGAWVDDYAAPDHLWLHMDHACGAHTCVEISFSYCFTAAQPIAHFTYQLVGTEGLIRFDRELKVFELRNAKGTRQLELAPEKNFAGMYQAFAQALHTGKMGDLPTAQDGLIAIRIARSATEQAMASRPRQA